MNSIRSLIFRFFALFRGGKLDHEMEEEIQAHLDMETERNMANGMSRKEARNAAKRAFGGVEQIQERERDARGIRWIEDTVRDVVYGARQLSKRPVFTAIVIFTLALGIGANTAIFSLVNTSFLRELPYPDPGQLVHLAESNQKTGGVIPVSYPNFLDWQEQQKVFSGIAVYHNADGRLKTATGVEMVAVQHVSADFFKLLGVRPERGRDMGPEDDLPGAARAAWITSDAWIRLFNGDPNILNNAFSLDGKSLAIMGILPSDFRFHRKADLITAIAPFANDFFLDMRANHSNEFAIGRLKKGISIEAARSQMDVIAQSLAEQYPDANKGLGVEVIPLRDRLSGDARQPLFLLFGAVGLVLLIACVNVANMLLARSLSRTREMAIRTSLGARRWQLLRQLLTESLILAIAGGAAGVFVGLAGYEFCSQLVPAQVRQVVDGSGFDFRMLLFVVGISLTAGVFFGLAPAWRSSLSLPIEALKQAACDAPSTVRGRVSRIGLSDLFVVLQVAIALGLLIAAGLTVRSLQKLLDVNTGFESERVLSLEVASPPSEQFRKDPRSFTRHFERVVDRVKSLPEVEATAVASGLPFTSNYNTITIYCGDRPIPNAGEFPSASLHTISPDYFRVMGIPLLRGRGFDGTEPGYTLPEGLQLTPENLGVIFKDMTFPGVISQKMADRFWPSEDPIGKRFRLGYPNMGLPWVTVAGVAGSTVQRGLDRGEATEFYLALNQWPQPINMHLVARSRVEFASIIKPIRDAVESAVPDGKVRDIRVLSERIQQTTSTRRFNRNLFASFAVLALLLALVGLYGVLAFTVGRRAREIGIRMAIGADRRNILRNVLGRGLALVATGLAIGLGCAWIGGRLLQSQLYEITGNDPLTYLGALLSLVIAAVISCLIPARRATKVDPMVALRTE